MNGEDILSSIKNLIIVITFIFSIYLIIYEIYGLTNLAFYYNYYSDYGKALSKLCGNSKMEYETPRFQIYSNIDKYILTNDYYNSNYTLFILLFVLIIIFIIIFSFAYLFYETFDLSNVKTLKDLPNTSYIKIIIDCLCGDMCLDNINDCIVYYLILAFIILFFPISLFLKVFMDVDLFKIILSSASYTNPIVGYLVYIYIIFFALILLIRIPTSLIGDSNTLKDNYKKYISIFIYYIFIVYFVFLVYYFNDLYDTYMNKASILNLYDNKSNFYDIYSRTPPNKPADVISEVPSSFRFLSKAEIELLTTEDKNKYYNNIEKMNEYKSNVKEYNNNVDIYNIKTDIYNITNIFNDNNQLNYITDIFKNVIMGYNTIKPNILIFVGIIVILLMIYYYIIKDNNLNEAKLYYNCIILSIISIFLILLLINSISVYNTYINKYVIFEPLSKYKNDIFNLNKQFTDLINTYKQNKIYNRPYNKAICDKICTVFNNNITVPGTQLGFVQSGDYSTDRNQQPSSYFYDDKYLIHFLNFVFKNTITPETLKTEIITETDTTKNYNYTKYKNLIDNSINLFLNMKNGLKLIYTTHYNNYTKGKCGYTKNIKEEFYGLLYKMHVYNVKGELNNTFSKFITDLKNEFKNDINHIDNPDDINKVDVIDNILYNNIINNYNIINDKYKYVNNEYIPFSYTLTENLKNINKKESNIVLSNTNIVNNSIFIIFIIFIIVILEPIYIES